MTSQPEPQQKRSSTLWIGLAGLVLAAAVGFTAGFSGALMLVSIYLAATFGWARYRGRCWAGPMSPRLAERLAILFVILIFIGAAVPGRSDESSDSAARTTPAPSQLPLSASTD
jgi:hypothetical protein